MPIMNEPVQLMITDRDVHEFGGYQLAKELVGDAQAPILGKKGIEAIDELMSLVPKIITEKLKKIIPEGYAVSEIVLNMKVRGSFAILGIDGEMQLKMKPKD